MAAPRKKNAPAIKAKPPSAKTLAARAQGATWRAWSSELSEEHAEMELALPPSTVRPDFRLARAILTLCAPDKSRPTLAMDDEAWGWSPAAVALRSEALEAPASESARLAELMMGIPEAPWRRWACASLAAPQLLASLDKLGHREPAIASLGAASLPCLMGFSGLPLQAWIKTASQACSAGAFASVSHGEHCPYFFQDLLSRAPEAFPDLPTRPGYGPEFSRSSDAMDLASTSLGSLLVFAALGLPAPEGRPTSQEPFAAARATPFFARLIGSEPAGLPKDFDHHWPLLRALFIPRQPSLSSARLLIAQGASLTDVCSGLALWEHTVQPRCETGSEGWYAPIDDPMMELLCESLDSLEPTRLIAEWGAAAPGKDWSGATTLSDFYALALDSGRAKQANDDLAPWLARMEARQLAAVSHDAPRKPREAL